MCGLEPHCPNSKTNKNNLKQTSINPVKAGFNIQKQPIYFYAILFAFCFIVYGNTIPNEYSLDDHLVSNHNKLVEKGFGGLYEIFTTNYISDSGVYLDYRPLVKATFAIEYALFGWNPHISHVLNILLYALGCCLMLRLLIDVFGKQHFTVLFTGLLLYAAHPMHTEVVASLKSRDEILVLIFIFLSAISMVKYTQTGLTKHLLWGLVFYMLSLLSKISGIPFIVLIPGMMYLKGSSLKKAGAIAGTLAAITIVYYGALLSLLPGLARPYEYVETPLPYIHDLSVRFGTAFYSLLYYVKLLIAPYQFSFYYGINYIQLQPFGSVWPLVSLVLYVGMLVGAVFTFWSNRIVSVMLFFYLAQISMASNLVLPMPGIVGERVLFIASLPFCVIVAWIINRLLNTAEDATEPKKDKKPKESTDVPFQLAIGKGQLAVMVVLLVFYTYTTMARNTAWKDTITLFETDMPHLEKSAKANYMMAKEIRRIYRTDKELNQAALDSQAAKAIRYYNQAIAAYPKYAIAMEELAMIYAIELNNSSMAVPLFERAFEADSTLWRSASNLGKAYQMSGDTATAITWYEKSVRAKPDNARALVELGKLYYLKGDKKKALATNDSLLLYNPDSHLPYYNYAIYYMLEGDTGNAVKYFEEDIRRGETERFPYIFLVKHYLQAGDTGNALRVRNFMPRVSR